MRLDPSTRLLTVDPNQISQAQIHPCSDHLACGRVPLWKRMLDCTLVILSAPLWLPLGVILAVFVKVVSPGPALFRQQRVGHMGAKFCCFKFRTMKFNADTSRHREHLTQLMLSNSPMQKLDNRGDNRLIPGGIWLRTLGLDELPQLINILRGEMSLVGPRPCVYYEYEKFLPRHRQRCLTLPGLTGLWQVSGKNRTTFQAMMDLDLCYVENKSLLLDIIIIARTPPAILGQLWDVKGRRILPVGLFMAKREWLSCVFARRMEAAPQLAGEEGQNTDGMV